MLLGIIVLERLDRDMAPVDGERDRVIRVIDLAMVGLDDTKRILDYIEGNYQQNRKQC